jgi:hypothetical protein
VYFSFQVIKLREKILFVIEKRIDYPERSLALVGIGYPHHYLVIRCYDLYPEFGKFFYFKPSFTKRRENNLVVTNRNDPGIAFAQKRICKGIYTDSNGKYPENGIFRHEDNPVKRVTKNADQQIVYHQHLVSVGAFFKFVDTFHRFTPNTYIQKTRHSGRAAGFLRYEKLTRLFLPF